VKLIKTFTRFDGMRVEVVATIYTTISTADYSYTVKYCEKGKRKFIPIPEGFIADNEVNNTLEELWLKIKPPVLVTPNF